MCAVVLMLILYDSLITEAGTSTNYFPVLENLYTIPYWYIEDSPQPMVDGTYKTFLFPGSPANYLHLNWIHECAKDKDMTYLRSWQHSKNQDYFLHLFNHSHTTMTWQIVKFESTEFRRKIVHKTNTIGSQLPSRSNNPHFPNLSFKHKISDKIISALDHSHQESMHKDAYIQKLELRIKNYELAMNQTREMIQIQNAETADLSTSCQKFKGLTQNKEEQIGDQETVLTVYDHEAETTSFNLSPDRSSLRNTGSMRDMQIDYKDRELTELKRVILRYQQIIDVLQIPVKSDLNLSANDMTEHHYKRTGGDNKSALSNSHLLCILIVGFIFIMVIMCGVFRILHLFKERTLQQHNSINLQQGMKHTYDVIEYKQEMYHREFFIKMVRNSVAIQEAVLEHIHLESETEEQKKELLETFFTAIAKGRG